MQSPNYLVWTDGVGYERTIFDRYSDAEKLLHELKQHAAYCTLEMQVRQVYLSELDFTIEVAV